MTEFHRSDKSVFTIAEREEECTYMELSFQKVKVKLLWSIISLYIAPAEFKIRKSLILKWENGVMQKFLIIECPQTASISRKAMSCTKGELHIASMWLKRQMLLCVILKTPAVVPWYPWRIPWNPLVSRIQCIYQK